MPRRIADEPCVITSITVPGSVMRKVKELASRRGCTVSALLREAIGELLAKAEELQGQASEA